MGDVPLLGAARRGRLDVIQWFFARERATLMGATLAVLLPLVARSNGKRVLYQNHWSNDPMLLETLLSSPVFMDYVDDDSKQSMLDSIASHCQSFQLINVAIAHGARVNETLNRIAQFCANDCVAELAEAGAFLVGAELLQPPFVSGEYEDAESFLEHGVDWGSGPAMRLNGAAAFGDDVAVEALLVHGFVDVDARDSRGMTPLMRVSTVNPTTDLHPQFGDPTPRIARLLLQTCDINLTDNNGCTALHYAVQYNHGVAGTLLSCGADVTIRDSEGCLAVDKLYHWPGWRSLLSQFLVRGIDPFAIPCGEVEDDDDSDDNDEVDNVISGFQQTRRSLYDRLLEMEGGPEFIRENPRYFNRD